MSTRTKKPKKITLAELGAMVEHIVNHMATKDDLDALDAKLAAHIDAIGTRLVAVESKVDGINRRLDTEAMMRTDQKLPERVTDLEIELFGTSKAPKST